MPSGPGTRWDTITRDLGRLMDWTDESGNEVRWRVFGAETRSRKRIWSLGAIWTEALRHRLQKDPSLEHVCLFTVRGNTFIANSIWVSLLFPEQP